MNEFIKKIHQYKIAVTIEPVPYEKNHIRMVMNGGGFFREVRINIEDLELNSINVSHDLLNQLERFIKELLPGD